MNDPGHNKKAKPMSKKNLKSSTALVVAGFPDTYQEKAKPSIPLMHDLLNKVVPTLKGLSEAEDTKESVFKNLGIRATMDAPSLLWMVKGAPGYDLKYLQSVNTRITDKVKASGVLKNPDRDADKYAQYSRDYAAEYVLAFMETNEYTGPEISDEVNEALQKMAYRTPAGKIQKAKEKEVRDNAESSKESKAATDEGKCAELAARIFKLASKEGAGPWAIKYLAAVKNLIPNLDNIIA
jgi:hypothetical protein